MLTVLSSFGRSRGVRISAWPPGFINKADPKAILALHKAIGSNVIRTSCVFYNGHDWYHSELNPSPRG